MRPSIWAAVLVAVIASDSGAQSPKASMVNDPHNDPVSLERPLSHWIKVIHDRNTEELGEAYEAIMQLGPAASAAVPELTKIVAEPFTPIRIGKDSKSEMLSKLHGIFVRGGAVDSLGAIGEGAAPAAHSVIEWALTIRVLPPEERSADPLFIELVTMDVLERMRGAGTVAQFGVEASPDVQELMESPDSDRRKFAVAVLNERALPIISELMNSESCRQRKLGLLVLADMWPVVASSHLDALTEILACTESDTGFAAKKTGLRGLD